MKKQAAGSEKAFFSKSGTSCNIQVSAAEPQQSQIRERTRRDRRQSDPRRRQDALRRHARQHPRRQRRRKVQRHRPRRLRRAQARREAQSGGQLLHRQTRNRRVGVQLPVPQLPRRSRQMADQRSARISRWMEQSGVCQ